MAIADRDDDFHMWLRAQRARVPDGSAIAYFMASGTHYMLEGVDYLSLYGEAPGEIAMAFAIFANVIKLTPEGKVLNFIYAQRRATDYLQAVVRPVLCCKAAVRGLGAGAVRIARSG